MIDDLLGALTTPVTAIESVAGSLLGGGGIPSGSGAQATSGINLGGIGNVLSELNPLSALSGVGNAIGGVAGGIGNVLGGLTGAITAPISAITNTAGTIGNMLPIIIIGGLLIGGIVVLLVILK